MLVHIWHCQNTVFTVSPLSCTSVALLLFNYCPNRRGTAYSVQFLTVTYLLLKKHSFSLCSNSNCTYLQCRTYWALHQDESCFLHFTKKNCTAVSFSGTVCLFIFVMKCNVLFIARTWEALFMGQNYVLDFKTGKVTCF